jgi:hypothetical protein
LRLRVTSDSSRGSGMPCFFMRRPTPILAVYVSWRVKRKLIGVFGCARRPRTRSLLEEFREILIHRLRWSAELQAPTSGAAADVIAGLVGAGAVNTPQNIRLYNTQPLLVHIRLLLTSPKSSPPSLPPRHYPAVYRHPTSPPCPSSPFARRSSAQSMLAP